MPGASPEATGRRQRFSPSRRSASTVERLVLAGAEDFLAETLPRLERYYRYLATNRDPDSDGLISTICQFETGLDYSPAYDQSLSVRFDQPLRISMAVRRVKLANKLTGYDLERIFASERHVEDVLVNTIWIDNLKALARLARRANEEELASWAEAKAVQALQSLLERSWDVNRGLFFNLDGSEEKRPDVKTIQCLMPLLLTICRRRLVRAPARAPDHPKEFGAPYPVPSVALDEPSYSDGCTSAEPGDLARPVLDEYQLVSLAGTSAPPGARARSHLVERSLSVVERSGFNEFSPQRAAIRSALIIRLGHAGR